jgi:osmotically-inducible protein OsmY
MNDRNRFERNRGQRNEEHDWNSDYYNDDRSFGSRGPGSRGRSGYFNEDSNSRFQRGGYSRLGGAGEEDFERSSQGGYQSWPDYGRDYSDERSYYGSDRSYGQERGSYGQERGNYGQRGQLGGGGRNQFPYMGNAYSSQRSFDEGSQGTRYGYGQPSQGGQSGQRSERGRFAGRGPKGYKRSDERIREEVSDALMMHPDIDASELEVRVSEGEVTLTGTVTEREDKWLAEQLCEGIPGVRDVSNGLRVKRSNEHEGSSTNDTSQRNARSGTQGSSNMTQGGTSNSSRA